MIRVARQSGLDLANESNDEVACGEVMQEWVELMCGERLTVSQAVQLTKDSTKMLSECSRLLSAGPGIKVFLAEDYVPGARGDANLKRSNELEEMEARARKSIKRDWSEGTRSPFESIRRRFALDDRRVDSFGREKCRACGKSCVHYCADCVVVTPAFSEAIEGRRVRLPVRVDVVLSHKQSRRKATSLQAVVLAEEGACAVVPFHPASETGGIPDYDPNTTAVLFPADDAKRLEDLDDEQSDSLERILVIEGPWTHASFIARHPRIARLQRVTIRPRESTYWRLQRRSSSLLSSVEAMYYVLVEYLTRSGELTSRDAGAVLSPFESARRGYGGEVDGLLMLYAHRFRHVSRLSVKPQAWR